VSDYKGRNEGTNTVKSIKRKITPGDVVSTVIISPNAHASRADPSWIIPVVTNVFVDYPTANSTHLTMGMRFINSLAGFGEKRKFNFIKVSTLVRLIRILGLMAVLSYMIVILFTWIYANHQGYVYFSAGEPVSLIKYPEWVLGFLGIFATASVLRRELDNMIS